MSDSYLDHIPSNEREKIRKRMRSPEAYERLREKVKGPEDIEKEMDRSEKIAELHFALESEPHLKETLKKTVEKDMQEQGMENVLEEVSDNAKKVIEAGDFSVTVESHPQTNDDALVVMVEGNVQEKIPVKASFSEKYHQQYLKQQ